MPTKPASHTLYYFKRPFDSSAKAEWEQQVAESRELVKKQREQRAAQKQSTGNPQPGEAG